MLQSVEIFFCYAHEDESLRQGIEKQLRVLKRQGFVSLWHDRNIGAGTEWQKEIHQQLEAAQIILLLVSPDFIDSDYCYSTEMKRAMERHEQGDAHVIPVILRPVYWQEAPFGKLQVLPTGAKPVSSWSNLDDALFDVAEGIRKRIEKLRNRENTSPSTNSLSLSYSVTKPIHFQFPKVLQKHRRSVLVLFFTLLCLGLLIGADRVWLLVTQQNQLYAYLTATDAANAYWVATAKEVQFGFDPAHTRWNRYERIINTTDVTGLALRWSYQTGGTIYSSPTVSSGIVYVGSVDGKLYAFDATCHNACQPLWSYQTGDAVGSSPAVANGVVYVGSGDGKLYAFDATCRNACQPLWSYLTGDKIDSSPAVANNMVYVGSFNGKFYAFDAACRSACQPLWSYPTGGGIFSSPAVANDLVYVGSGVGFYAFDATCRNSCRPLWFYVAGKAFGSSPAVANGVVYVGSDNHKFYAFDAACRSACQPLWSYLTGGGIFSSPAVANGVVYIGSDDGKLYAFDTTCHSSCQPIWSYQTSYYIQSSPTVANGTIYVGSDDHILYALEPST
jgi:outer membrane protein assembly factor BamB